MPRLAPKALKLEDEEKKELEKILARHSTSQQIAKRGQIILLAAKRQKSSSNSKRTRSE